MQWAAVSRWDPSMRDPPHTYTLSNSSFFRIATCHGYSAIIENVYKKCHYLIQTQTSSWHVLTSKEKDRKCSRIPYIRNVIIMLLEDTSKELMLFAVSEIC